MEFQIIAEIESTDRSEMLAVMNWIKTKYAAKVHQASASTESKTVKVTILESTYDDAVTIFEDVLNTYTDRAEKTKLVMNQ